MLNLLHTVLFSVLSTCISWLNCILYSTTSSRVGYITMSELSANKIQVNFNKSIKTAIKKKVKCLL